MQRYFRFPSVIFYREQIYFLIFQKTPRNHFTSIQHSSTKHRKVNDSGCVNAGIFHPYSLPSTEWHCKQATLKTCRLSQKESKVVYSSANHMTDPYSVLSISLKPPGTGNSLTILWWDSPASESFNSQTVLRINPHGLIRTTGPHISYSEPSRRNSTFNNTWRRYHIPFLSLYFRTLSKVFSKRPQQLSSNA